MMIPSLQTAWPVLVAIVAGAVGLLVLFWALFADRSRGRRRCPHCWYDMSMAAADETGRFTCPECGKVMKSTGPLHRTRRHKRWAALGVMIILIALCLPTAMNEGPVKLIPDWVLVRLPLGGEKEWFDHYAANAAVQSRYAKEVVARWDADTFGSSSREYWIQRVIGVLQDEDYYGIPEYIRRIHEQPSTIPFGELDHRSTNRDLISLVERSLDVRVEPADSADIPSSYLDAPVYSAKIHKTHCSSGLGIFDAFIPLRGVEFHHDKITYGSGRITPPGQFFPRRTLLIDLHPLINARAASEMNLSSRSHYRKSLSDRFEWRSSITYTNGLAIIQSTSYEKLLDIEQFYSRLMRVVVHSDESFEREQLFQLEQHVNRIRSSAIYMDRSRPRLEFIAYELEDALDLDVVITSVESSTDFDSRWAS